MPTTEFSPTEYLTLVQVERLAVILQHLREEAERLEGELRATRYVLASGRETSSKQFGVLPEGVGRHGDTGESES